MRNRKIIPIRNFNQNLFAILAIVAFIAIVLATIDMAYEVVKKGVEMLGGVMPPKEIFQNTAANVALGAAGAMVLLVGFIVAVPLIKVAVVVTGLAIVGLAIYNLYRTFTGKPSESVLPSGMKIDRK